MTLKLFYSLILLSSDKPSFEEKIGMVFKIIVAFAPIAYIMNGLGVWFNNNHMFFSFVLWTLFVNMFVGALYHRKEGDFSWFEFWKANIKMWAIILLVYPLLEMLSIIAGDNFAGETFKIVIQVNTLLYPASKILKNIYLWSDRKYPPEWIMERIYRFEKTGDMAVLTKPKEDEQ